MPRARGAARSRPRFAGRIVEPAQGSPIETDADRAPSRSGPGVTASSRDHCHQIPRIPLPARGIAGIEVDRADEVGPAASQSQSWMNSTHASEVCASARPSSSARARRPPPAPAACLRSPARRGSPPPARSSRRVRCTPARTPDLRPRPARSIAPLPRSLAGPLVPCNSGPSDTTARRGGFGVPLGHRIAEIAEKRRPEGCHDGARDLVLQLENVVHAAVIALGPEQPPIGHVG